MIGIYKITSPRGKIYIGQSKDILNRWNDYKRLNCKGQRKLYYSFSKYGVENHLFEIIEECLLEELDSKERYWQEFYGVIKEGLNLEVIGERGFSKKFSEESLKRMADAQKGKKHTEKTKLILSERHKGLKHTEETKEKIIKALKLRVRSQETYRKIAEKNKGRKMTAESKLKISNSKKGKKDSEEVRRRKSESHKHVLNEHSMKSIDQFTLEGVYLRTWKSISEVGNFYDKIRNSLWGLSPTEFREVGGFLWKKS